MNTTDIFLPDLVLIDEPNCIDTSVESALEPVWYWQIEKQLSSAARMEQTNEDLKVKLSGDSTDSIDLAMTLKEMIGHRSGLGKLSYLVKATMSTKH